MSAMRVCVPGAHYFFRRSNKIFFPVVRPRGLIFEESPKSIQDVSGDVFSPGKYCSNREKCESLGGYVTTLRSIIVVESVEPGCLFTKFVLRYKST